MRPICFHKGLLSLEVPSKVANTATDVRAWQHSEGGEWALEIAYSGGVFLAAGTFLQDGPRVEVSGSEVLTPMRDDWKQGARVMAPEPWAVVKMFGRSAKTLHLGSD